MSIDFTTDAEMAERIRHAIRRNQRVCNARDGLRRRQRTAREVDALLAHVEAEAWGDALTETEARQRIAEQEARMHGAGGLF